MSIQEVFHLPQSTTSNITMINTRCSLCSEDNQTVVYVAGLPVHHYSEEDKVARAYAMVFLVDSGFALQKAVARAFACSTRTVRRNQSRYAEGGMAALDLEGGWKKGKRRIKNSRLKTIHRMNEKGLSNREIARQLGVKENAIRKVVGPTIKSIYQQPTFPEMEIVESTESNKISEEGNNNGSDSLDNDPSNRLFDRLLARAGLLNDAAPLFRDGSAVSGAGVLLAIPHLVSSGIFKICENLYSGGIGPAFYGLRTTILTLLLMALLRIKHPEALKEREVHLSSVVFLVSTERLK